MALHEKLKSAKIIEEITGYLLERGYKSIDISLRLKDKETTVVVIVEDKGEDLIKVFKKDLYCCREIELEEYGVDQLHHSQCTCTMNTLGMLVDHYEIRKEEDKFIITLHRLK